MAQRSETFEEYWKNLRRVHDKRKISPNINMKTIYRSSRQTNKFVAQVTCEEYHTIIKEVNTLIVEELANGKIVTLPFGLGILYVHATECKVSVKDGKIVHNLPVSPALTYRLWYDDEEAASKKQLVYLKPCVRYDIKWDRTRSKFVNKKYYKLTPRRETIFYLNEHAKNIIL